MLKNQKMPYSWDKMLSRLPIGISIAAIGLFLGIFPSLNLNTYKLNFANAAYANDLSDLTISRYAKAAVEIERERRQFYNRISSVTRTPPSFACDNPATLTSLSSQARSMAEEFCRRSTNIVRQNNLTVEQFNDITRRRRSDRNLEQRIQQAIQRL